jgi:beta-phosphoglucomutase-like phosphatase (HAD superfamily)
LKKLEGGSLTHYFQKITTRDELSHGKPFPEGYLKTAAALGAKPHHCLVIEDSQTGIRAAKAAEMFVIGITTSHEPPILKAAGADLVMHTYPEIEAWLLNQF